MTWAHGPVVTRRRLGGELKRLRDEAELKLDDVARELDCSTSKISRLETGKGIPRWRDVRDMLDVYGVPDGELRDRLLGWAQNGRARMWWQDYADVIPPNTVSYVELEWDATTITAYETQIPHGLLQTRDYARAVLRTAWGDQKSPADIERLVEVRMRRQEALLPHHGLHLVCVVDESVLHRVTGSPAILADQLRHLVALAEAEHVDLRVLPFSAGLVPNSREAFAVLDFAEGVGPGVVYVERPGDASEYLADTSGLQTYRARMAGILAAALTEAESVPLLRRALEAVEPSGSPRPAHDTGG